MNASSNQDTATASTPRIYVASLSDYNAGNLHGRWIDADQPASVIHEQITRMLGESAELGAEEWAIHDYENFGGLRLSEFEDIETVAEMARLIQEHGPVFAKLAEYFGGTSGVKEARESLEERYHGEFDTVEDYAAQLVEDCYSDALKQLPEFIRFHIDYEGIAHDMEVGSDIFTIEQDGKVHVFSTR
jgi:antirestriction protein